MASVRCDQNKNIAICRPPPRARALILPQGAIATEDHEEAQRATTYHPQVRPQCQTPLSQHSPLQAIQPSNRAKPSRLRARSVTQSRIWSGMASHELKQPKRPVCPITGFTRRLRSPPVKQHYLSELDVLRTSERARNIHRAVEIREQTSNQMASIQAIKLLEQISDDAPASRGSVSLPGLVIVVNTGAPLTQPPTIDADMKVISE
jgi:hypothetical protein